MSAWCRTSCQVMDKFLDILSDAPDLNRSFFLCLLSFFSTAYA